MTRHRHVVASVCVMLGAALPIAAHPIVIHTGVVHWEGRSLRVVLDVDPHSLRHEIEATGSGAAPRQLTLALATSIHVVSHDAGRIFAAQTEVSENGAQVSCRYEIPEDVAAVALVHRPDHGLGPLPRQIQLQWFQSEARHPRTIRLTSAGNHAVLLRNGGTGTGAACDPFIEPLFRVAARRHEPQLHVEIDFPCTLLAMWPDLIAVRDDALTVHEFRSRRPNLTGWASQCLSLEGSEHEPQSLSVQQVDLVAPSGEIISDAGEGAYSIYTTRVRIRFEHRPAAADAWTELTWRGFNSAVLRLAVVCQSAGEESFVGVLTPAQATVRIAHSDPPEASVRPTRVGAAVGRM